MFYPINPQHFIYNLTYLYRQTESQDPPTIVTLSCLETLSWMSIRHNHYIPLSMLCLYNLQGRESRYVNIETVESGRTFHHRSWNSVLYNRYSKKEPEVQSYVWHSRSLFSSKQSKIFGFGSMNVLQEPWLNVKSISICLTSWQPITLLTWNYIKLKS